MEIFATISQGMFPNNLKLADITPAHKKGERQDKGNYRPMSILSPISKVYERILYSQLYNAFDDILSISQCGFRRLQYTALSNCHVGKILKIHRQKRILWSLIN